MVLVPGMICLQKELDLERSKVNESPDLWLFTHKFHVKSCKPACAMKCVLMLIHRIHGILSLHESLICIIYDLHSYDSFNARIPTTGMDQDFFRPLLQFIEKKTGAVPPAAPWLQLDEPVICCNKVSQLNVKGMMERYIMESVIGKIYNGINHWSLIKTCSWLW